MSELNLESCWLVENRYVSWHAILKKRLYKQWGNYFQMEKKIKNNIFLGNFWKTHFWVQTKQKGDKLHSVRVRYWLWLFIQLPVRERARAREQKWSGVRGGRRISGPHLRMKVKRWRGGGAIENMKDLTDGKRSGCLDVWTSECYVSTWTSLIQVLSLSLPYLPDNIILLY